MTYPEGKGLLANNHFWFRRDRAAADAVGSLVEKAFSLLNGGQHCIVVYLDMAMSK